MWTFLTFVLDSSISHPVVALGNNGDTTIRITLEKKPSAILLREYCFEALDRLRRLVHDFFCQFSQFFAANRLNHPASLLRFFKKGGILKRRVKGRP